MRRLLSYFRTDSGAAAAEYALILALVGAGIAAAALGLGEAVSDALSAASSIVVNHLP